MVKEPTVQKLDDLAVPPRYFLKTNITGLYVYIKFQYTSMLIITLGCFC